MKIIAATENNEPIPQEQIDKDMSEILRQHQEALKSKRVSTWEVFGGVITIQNRQYQVV